MKIQSKQGIISSENTIYFKENILLKRKPQAQNCLRCSEIQFPTYSRQGPLKFKKSIKNIGGLNHRSKQHVQFASPQRTVTSLSPQMNFKHRESMHLPQKLKDPHIKFTKPSSLKYSLLKQFSPSNLDPFSIQYVRQQSRSPSDYLLIPPMLQKRVSQLANKRVLSIQMQCRSVYSIDESEASDLVPSSLVSFGLNRDLIQNKLRSPQSNSFLSFTSFNPETRRKENEPRPIGFQTLESSLDKSITY